MTASRHHFENFFDGNVARKTAGRATADQLAEGPRFELAIRFSKFAFEMSKEFRLIVPKVAT